MPQAVYYQAKNIRTYPSGNSVDEGKLNLEENLTRIVTRITKRNFVLDKNHFKLSLKDNIVTVTKGKANIQGYCIETDVPIEVGPPDSSIPVIEDEYTDIYLCMKLALDGSDHVLGDVNAEDGRKYFYGTYLGWYIKDDIDDLTLVLGTAKWDGKNIKDLEENPDKTQVIDSSNINIFPGLSLMKFIDLLPDIFISKDGNKVQDGKGGNFYGQLYGMTSRSDESYGIRIGCTSKNSSSIELKPVTANALDAEKKVIIEAATNPMLKLGYSTMRYVNKTLDISGANVVIQNKTTVNKTFHVNPQGRPGASGNHYDFYEDRYEHSFIATDTYIIKTSHNIKSDDQSSEITFQNKDKSIWTGINYSYSFKILKIYGLDSKMDVQMPMEAQKILAEELRFKDTLGNTHYINSANLDLGNATGGLVYGSSGSNHTLTLRSSGNTTLNIIGSRGSNTITETGMSITAAPAEIAMNGVTINVGEGSTEMSVNASHSEFSGTLRATKVYNAVYNDYAEAYEKVNEDDVVEPGDIICLDVPTGKYRKVNSYSDAKLVVGVCSDTYAQLLGGEKGMTEEEILKKYIPVGLAGRVYVKVDPNHEVLPGDLLETNSQGLAVKAYDLEYSLGQIIGKALGQPKDGKVLMQIMLI